MVKAFKCHTKTTKTTFYLPTPKLIISRNTHNILLNYCTVMLLYNRIVEAANMSCFFNCYLFQLFSHKGKGFELITTRAWFQIPTPLSPKSRRCLVPDNNKQTNRVFPCLMHQQIIPIYTHKRAKSCQPNRLQGRESFQINLSNK